jgi:DNA-directed RNA polymerase specialized sigma24 family protein
MAALSEATAQDQTAEAAFERRLAAVTQAVDDFQGYLQDYLYRLTHQWQDAENLLQDLWRHVLLHFDEDKIHALPLLRRKAYQLFVDHYRRQVRRGEIVTDEVPEVEAATTSFADVTAAGEAGLREKFWADYPQIDLTAPQKEVLWLHARYGFTFKEIEQRSGVAASTIGDWIALGRKRLAAAINNQPTKR